MPALYITESEVRELLDIRAALEAVEEAFRRQAAGEVDNVPRHRAQAPGIVLHTMSAAVAYCGMVGWKCYTTTRHGARFHVALYDQHTGAMLALIEAHRLGQLRTGAATGVAAQWMALGDAAELGLLGSGFQAETQLEAIAAVRPLKEVFVYSRDAQRRAAFADRMSRHLALEVIPVDRPSEAVEDLPMVVTATNSSEPVLDGNWLAEGAFLAAIGSNWWHKAEIDVATVRRADRIVCDDIHACRHEAGDFRAALECGAFDWSMAVNLCDVVAGRHVGRPKSDSITLFKSVGLALEDVALAERLLHLARQRGLGQALPF